MREATEDQHRLGGDGVDHVANFLVIKHEVDELRDLDVIDGVTSTVASTLSTGLPCAEWKMRSSSAKVMEALAQLRGSFAGNSPN